MKTKPLRSFRESSIIALFIVACGGPQKAEPAPTAAPSAAPSIVQPLAPAIASPPSTTPVPAASSSEVEPTPPRAITSPLVISIEPKSGSKLKGTARFEATNTGVLVTVDITSAPAGKHGAHIHQNADCSSMDGKSAGDHFNPQMYEHGLPPTAMRHLGDLGNIDVAKDGNGHWEINIDGANLVPGDKSSFLGRGIVIQEKMDDGGQPAGNAGNRIGCGEIKR
jgi:superoxide dismutase, Cu-Zn family